MTQSNPFEILGLPLHFALSKTDLDTRLRDLSKVLHPDRHVGASANERRLALNRAIAMNEAVRVLRDPVSRGHALLAALLPGRHIDEARADQVFLLEVMELREQLANAQSKADWSKVQELGKQAQQGWNTTIERLTRQFSELEAAPSDQAEAAVTAILGELARLKYWQRLSDEVARIEAEQD